MKILIGCLVAGFILSVRAQTNSSAQANVTMGMVNCTVGMNQTSSVNASMVMCMPSNTSMTSPMPTTISNSSVSQTKNVTGNSSTTTVSGNSSAATVTGSSSTTTVSGNSSAATVSGGSSAPTVTGGGSQPTVSGGGSTATVTGGGSKATVTGGGSTATTPTTGPPTTTTPRPDLTKLTASSYTENDYMTAKPASMDPGLSDMMKRFCVENKTATEKCRVCSRFLVPSEILTCANSMTLAECQQLANKAEFQSDNIIRDGQKRAYANGCAGKVTPATQLPSLGNMVHYMSDDKFDTVIQSATVNSAFVSSLRSIELNDNQGRILCEKFTKANPGSNYTSLVSSFPQKVFCECGNMFKGIGPAAAKDVSVQITQCPDKPVMKVLFQEISADLGSLSESEVKANIKEVDYSTMSALPKSALCGNDYGSFTVILDFSQMAFIYTTCKTSWGSITCASLASKYGNLAAGIDTATLGSTNFATTDLICLGKRFCAIEDSAINSRIDALVSKFQALSYNDYKNDVNELQCIVPKLNTAQLSAEDQKALCAVNAKSMDIYKEPQNLGTKATECLKLMSVCEIGYIMSGMTAQDVIAKVTEADIKKCAAAMYTYMSDSAKVELLKKIKALYTLSSLTTAELATISVGLTLYTVAEIEKVPANVIQGSLQLFVSAWVEVGLVIEAYENSGVPTPITLNSASVSTIFVAAISTTSSARRRRNTPSASLTCDTLIGSVTTSLQDSVLQTLASAEVKKCASSLGEMAFSKAQFQIFANKAKQSDAFGQPSTWDTSVQASVKGIVSGLTAAEIGTLPIDDSAIAAISENGKWDDATATAAFNQWLKKVKSNSAPTVSHFDLKRLNSLVCGAGTGIISQFPSDAVGNARTDIGKVQGLCMEVQWVEYAKKIKSISTSKQLKDMNEADIKALGNILVGYTADDIKAIPPANMKFISPSVLKSMPNTRMTGFTKEQASAFSSMQSIVLSEAQISAMNAEAKDEVYKKRAVYGTLVNDQNNPFKSHAGSRRCLSTAAMIIGFSLVYLLK